MNAIQNGLEFNEKNITEDISANDVADHAHISSFYFQKGFSMLCGYTIAEYIRNRS